MGVSREGWHWNAADGLKPGLQTQAVIEPAQQVDEDVSVYDAIVIGAGYTGLTATRELTTSGKPRLRMVARMKGLTLWQASRLCCWKGETA
jgi:heterodisulfide reductase subunit A-like polyferredoxin